MKTDDPQRLAVRLRPVFKRQGVLRAILFGALAQGEPSRRSDLDLIVVKETDARFLNRYDEILQDITEAASGYDVDLLNLHAD